MADSKISALPASTVPLAGTEVLPIVQGSTTKQVSVANLTTGRAISATQLTLTTGSVIVASGQGIDFSATPGTGTSELFADYEEGTWTPVIIGSATSGTGTYGSQVGRYTKIGNSVRISLSISWSAHTGTGTTVITGFPFASNATGQTPFSVFTYGETFTALYVPNGGIMSNGATQWEHWQVPVGGGLSSGIPIYNGSAEIQISGVYQTT